MRITLELDERDFSEIKKEIGERVARSGALTDDVLSVPEAAELLGVSETSVRLLIRNNADFPCTRLGKKIRIVKSSLIDWVKDKRHIHISDFDGI